MEQFHCWWKAPTGYLNGARGEPSLIPDPERGQFITQLFDLLATGEWGKADAMARVTALGLRSRKGVPLTQETLRKVMTNPIYKGEIFVKVWGKSVRGDFVPLVTAATFDRVQAILDGRAPAHIAHVTDRDEFPLRGLLLCPKCQKTITASFSTGHLGKKFGNYRCHHGKNHINVSAGLVEAAFIALLERLTPKPERMRIIEKIFRERWGELVQASTTESLKLKQELGKLEARKERALVQVADGVLNEEDFATIRAKTTSAIADIQLRIEVAESSEVDLETSLAYIQHLLWNPSAIWQTAPLLEKQRLQRRIFPQGVLAEKTGIETPVTHSIYTLLADDSVEESVLVAPQGFVNIENK